MNHGKIDKEKAQTTLDKWNNAIARILGKKNKEPSDKNKMPTSDRKFGLIVVGMVVFLWLLTGIYYIPRNTYGIIMHNGKAISAKSGIAIGIDYPYPFSDIAIIDNVNSSLSIGKVENDQFLIVSKNNKSLQVIIEVVYRISDPIKYFINHYQENIDLKELIKGQTQSLIQSYIVSKNSDELLAGSTIVIANDIRKYGESQLSNFGIKIEKMALIKLSNPDILRPSEKLSSASNHTDPADQIIKEANQYQTYVRADLESQLREFNQLLPQYKSNPNAIAQLMYYKMLSSIPQPESATPDFSLLQGSLDEFKNKISQGNWSNHAQNDIAESDVRRLDRSVDREREFKGR